jgi:hypothetical protein
LATAGLDRLITDTVQIIPMDLRTRHFVPGAIGCPVRKDPAGLIKRGRHKVLIVLRRKRP